MVPGSATGAASAVTGGGRRRGSIPRSARIPTPECCFRSRTIDGSSPSPASASNYPPNDEAGYMETLTKLRSPLLAEAVKYAEPISEVYSHRSMANRWRRYDQWPAKLAGFVALGDAACAFNPVYGQGMTTGALSALTLRDTIAKFGLDHPELTGKFYAAQAQSSESAMGDGDRRRFRGARRRGSSSDVEPLVRSDLRPHPGLLGG